MGIKIINDVFDNSEMKGNDRLVMISIADNANNENRHAWPSVREISRKTRIPIRTVWRCIKRCVASGELKIVKSGTHEGESNLYEVLVKRSSPQTSDTLTGVPPNGIPPMPKLGTPPMPPSGTLTVIEPSRNRGRAPLSILDMKDIINAKNEIANRLKAQHSSETANGRKWSDEGSRVKYADLVRESREMTEKMASIK